MLGVAIVIAVDEVRPDFSHVTCSDRLAAYHTGGLRAGRPPIHQCESHVAPPKAKQNTVSDEKTFGEGALRWFLPSELSLFRSTLSGGTEM